MKYFYRLLACKPQITLIQVHSRLRYFHVFLLLLFLSNTILGQTINFGATTLNNISISNPTSLAFGPNNKLYVSEQYGTIWEITIERDLSSPGNGTYTALSAIPINIIKEETPNHNDDGQPNSLKKRLIVGLTVVGTPDQPIIYVSSSDSRIGGGNSTWNDINLDTNSGIIHRLVWNGNGWNRVDIVRGLPRCEENHATNGMQFVSINGTDYLFVQQGGNTNMGAPSNNFAGSGETTLSAALLTVNLSQLKELEVLNSGPFIDTRTGVPFIYDLPTLNDPSRIDIDNTHPEFPYSPQHPLHNATIDIGDPFGGNNSINQAFNEPGGPVQIFAPGFRNAYDVVITPEGKIFTSDNGPNSGWGGPPSIYDSNDQLKGNDRNDYFPENGDYISGEFNINNGTTIYDGLHFIGDINDTSNTYYGGHPVPIRAFPAMAGINDYEYDGSDWVNIASYQFGELLNGVSGYYNSSFTIADFPDDPRQGKYLSDGAENTEIKILDFVSASTNGICVYNASNFDNALNGNILTVSFNGKVNRYVVDENGTLISKDNNFLSGFGEVPLDIISQGDNKVFPGTLWVVNYTSSSISIFEPDDLGACPQPGDLDFDPLADYDFDNFSNQDELDNNTNHCSAGSRPDDADNDFISDLNDPDDDNDGISDTADPFPIDPDNGLTTHLPIKHPFWNNDPGTGFFGLGFTGLMIPNDGVTDYLTLFDETNLSFGGAGGKATIDNVSPGDAFENLNSQENAFQFGIQVDKNSDPFTIHTKIETPFNGNLPENGQSYGLFIGTGDQDNYLKVTVMNGTSDQDSTIGFEVILENNGTTESYIFDTPEMTQPSGIDLYLSVTPSTLLSEINYSYDGGETIFPLINNISLPASFLNPDDSIGLAVGIISTSSTSNKSFIATWDFIDIIYNQSDYLDTTLDIIDFGIIAQSSTPETLEVPLTNIGSPGDPTIQIDNITFSGNFISSSDSQFLPIVVDPGKSVNIPITIDPSKTSTGLKSEQIEIFHTGTNSPLLIPIQANIVEDSGLIITRVNVGGSNTIAATDNGPDWESNPIDEAYQGTSYSVNTGLNATAVFDFANKNISIPDYIDENTFNGIFQNERWDPAEGEEMEFQIPLTNGEYTVNIFVGNSYGLTDNIGDRVFDILIENNIVEDNFDPIAAFGHQVAGMLSYPVTVSDGVLQIAFAHEIENPIINAVEIIQGINPEAYPPISMQPISDQFSYVGDTPTLAVGATGGDPNENFNYSISGQPEGISIEPTNGQIIGAIELSAVSGGPNADGVHSVVITVSKTGSEDVSQQFLWSVSEKIIDPSFNPVARINVGGNSTVTSSDNGPDWESNPTNNAYQGASYSVNTGINATASFDFVNRSNSIPNYIDENIFNGIFQNERWDPTEGEEMEFQIPLDNGEYTVNLFVGNSYNLTNLSGDRIYDIFIEGNIVADNFDPIATFGHQVAGMLSYPVIVSDGVLNIGFGHEVENPIINAIEVIQGINPEQYPPITLEPLNDQISYVGDIPTLAVSAIGGDPNENFIYSISGQPEGIGIEPSTGQIIGAIAPSATSGGPSTDGVHSVVLTVSKTGSEDSSQQFLWTILEPGIGWNEKFENQNYTARHECSFVQAGDKFYLMGGRENSKTIDVYDYSNNTWENLQDSAPFEFNHFQAIEYQGFIWIITAFENNNFPNEIPTTNIWIYNPVDNTWINGPVIPENRRRGGAGVVLYNNKFYILGGNTKGHDGGFVSWFDEFDPATGTWTILPNAPHARDHFQATIHGNNLYAVSGRQSGGEGGLFAPLVSAMDIFNFETGEWLSNDPQLNIPTPRAAPITVNLNGKIIVAGGEVPDNNNALKITEIFDPELNLWTQGTELNHARHGTQAIVSGNSVYVTSGSPMKGGGSQTNMEYYNSDDPIGEPLFLSTLQTPDNLTFTIGSTQVIDIDLVGGNTGLWVNRIELIGLDSDEFMVLNNEIPNTLLTNSSTPSVTIEHIGSSTQALAELVITYNNIYKAKTSLSVGDQTNLSSLNPVVRINVGGNNNVITTDNGPDWESNPIDEAYQGTSYSVNTGLNATAVFDFANKNISIP
ncbi:malectin domain-containing carbohydrate-binding protein, partial [Robertkochia marina]